MCEVEQRSHPTPLARVGGRGLTHLALGAWPEAEIHGVWLYYEERGEGAPIACIHGGGSSAMMWGDAVKELARLGQVISYDRRGAHAASARSLTSARR